MRRWRELWRHSYLLYEKYGKEIGVAIGPFRATRLSVKAHGFSRGLRKQTGEMRNRFNGFTKGKPLKRLPGFVVVCLQTHDRFELPDQVSKPTASPKGSFGQPWVEEKKEQSGETVLTVSHKEGIETAGRCGLFADP